MRSGLSTTFKKAATGAPLLSTPSAGKDWEYLPSRNIDVASILDATTDHWPPRPLKRISIIFLLLVSFCSKQIKIA
jgi:hypothetical protein